jgi:hypothetical protein
MLIRLKHSPKIKTTSHCILFEKKLNNIVKKSAIRDEVKISYNKPTLEYSIGTIPGEL